MCVSYIMFLSDSCLIIVQLMSLVTMFCWFVSLVSIVSRSGEGWQEKLKDFNVNNSELDSVSVFLCLILILLESQLVCLSVCFDSMRAFQPSCSASPLLVKQFTQSGIFRSLPPSSFSFSLSLSLSLSRSRSPFTTFLCHFKQVLVMVQRIPTSI